jgi:GNAT superfamily N-acetyltransferase
MPDHVLPVARLAIEDIPYLSEFRCGDSDLDEFLSDDAWRLQIEQVAVSYVAWSADGSQVLGYATLLVDGVHLQTRERKSLGLASQDHPVVPALKIARLAVGQQAQRTGVGIRLVATAFAAARLLAEQAGCRLLVVDAYPTAVSFYQKLGFRHNRSPEYRDRENPSLRLDVFAPELPTWLQD